MNDGAHLFSPAEPGAKYAGQASWIEPHCSANTHT
jgi:hypothetical protein